MDSSKYRHLLVVLMFVCHEQLVVSPFTIKGQFWDKRIVRVKILPRDFMALVKADGDAGWPAVERSAGEAYVRSL